RRVVAFESLAGAIGYFHYVKSVLAELGYRGIVRSVFRELNRIVQPELRNTGVRDGVPFPLHGEGLDARFFLWCGSRLVLLLLGALAGLPDPPDPVAPPEPLLS